MIDNKSSLSPAGRGHFFAVDRRAWAAVCRLDMASAVAYLVMARGSAADQRTTSWSVHAIETHTSIGRPRANAAIQRLVEHRFVHVLRSGTRPRYYLMGAHEIHGSENYRSPLSATECKLLDFLQAAGPTPLSRLPAGLNIPNPRGVAEALEQKKYARLVDARTSTFRAVLDAELGLEPDWIWLPNTLIDGVSGHEAPVELIRQTQNIAVLRLLIDCYYAHLLCDDGGIHWSKLGLRFPRHHLGSRDGYDIYGFETSAQRFVGPGTLLIAPYVFGPKSRSGNHRYFCGLAPFWRAWDVLTSFGLVEFVLHVVEADTAEAEIIHPYGVGNGEPAEQHLAAAAHAAARAMLSPEAREPLKAAPLHLVPVPGHFREVQMVGVARLRHRPLTRATTEWLNRIPQWEAKTKEFRILAKHHQGRMAGCATSRILKATQGYAMM